MTVELWQKRQSSRTKIKFLVVQLYHNPLDVLFYECNIITHKRCIHDSKKTYEVIYDTIYLPDSLICTINEYFFEPYLIILNDNLDSKSISFLNTVYKRHTTFTSIIHYPILAVQCNNINISFDYLLK